ncbi:hypothetical protein QBC41DRAFT_143436 [Cercophora samala]|uniref:Uncharacterized protein n=1 Tax=Cercophora samala TaxID=330535 RepID=A0AA39ZLA7_9PEZI|nr:hypothetical protein QBC41DRAFT_143436 [Cercophora samala]
MAGMCLRCGMADSLGRLCNNCRWLSGQKGGQGPLQRMEKRQRKREGQKQDALSPQEASLGRESTSPQLSRALSLSLSLSLFLLSSLPFSYLTTYRSSRRAVHVQGCLKPATPCHAMPRPTFSPLPPLMPKQAPLPDVHHRYPSPHHITSHLPRVLHSRIRFGTGKANWVCRPLLKKQNRKKNKGRQKKQSPQNMSPPSAAAAATRKIVREKQIK